MYIEGEVPTVTTNGGYGNGYGMGFGGDWAWILILLLFAGNGWGNGFGGGNNMLYDINANTNRGFDQLAVTNGIDALQSAVTSGFANAQVQNCNSTTNLLQAINGVSMGLQQCLKKLKKPFSFITNKFAIGTCVE